MEVNGQLHASAALPMEIPLLIISFLVSWDGLRLSPLGTSATNSPVVPAPDDRWWMWSSRWNENWHGKPKYSEITCPSATLSTKNPTWPDLGSNTGPRCEKPAINRLSYGTAFTHCIGAGGYSPVSHLGGPCSIPYYVGFVVDKMALGRIVSEYFGFPCLLSTHKLLHIHQSINHQSSDTMWSSYWERC
jgi:hypothetical protein